jgi:hypothetical protein
MLEDDGTPSCAPRENMAAASGSEDLFTFAGDAGMFD